MVKYCDECGEYAYATRFKDSWLAFCRACGYWREDGMEGFYDEEKLEDMVDKWPLRGYDESVDSDPSLWADG